MTTTASASIQYLSDGIAKVQQDILLSATGTASALTSTVAADNLKGESSEALLSALGKQKEEIERLKVALLTVSQLSRRAQTSLGLERKTTMQQE